MSKKNGKSSNGTLRRIAPEETNGSIGSNGVAGDVTSARLSVLKTYKIYIGGKFPRSESGRAYLAKDKAGHAIANVCDCSRKDFRDAVVAARDAQTAWVSRAAFNRSQILYRIAEMMEGRRAQFVDELTQCGLDASAASSEVQASIDRWLYYAGWCDKLQQIFSSVNPVSSSHFNFSLLEATGVVSIIASEESSLLGLTSVLAPVIGGGNTCVALASNASPLAAVTLAEVLATSDLPGGVVNLLTGRRAELIGHMSSHMDVNAMIYCGDDAEEMKTVRTNGALNVKRVTVYDDTDWLAESAQSPYRMLDTQEVKTTWHPVGV